MRIRTPFHFMITKLAVALLVPCIALAADVPPRKSGLWELRTESTVDGQKMPGPTTMQLCVEQAKDDMTADPGDKSAMRKRCSKMDVKRSGSKTVIDSVCAMDGHTATGRTVITGDLATDYRMENTTRFAPPMQGMQTMSSSMTGKWLGPCKAGQKHGSMTMSGMPGVDPEMMKRMQQQYER